MYWDGKTEVRKEMIPKNRPDDFEGEVDHIAEILAGRFTGDSPISLERGLDTMLVITAAHVSHQNQSTVRINYEKGYRLDAIEIL